MMDIKKIIYGLKIATVVAVLATAALPLYAQEYVGTPVTVSKEKINYKGKICYTHVVLEKQTLFSIAKAYDVTVEDIMSFNPSIKEDGLKKNSIIIIPSKDALKQKSEPVPAKEEIQKDEPEKEAQVKQETVKESKPEKKKKEKKEKQKIHVRQWYEDLDVIAKKYNVTVEALMKANGLTGRKLKNRQKLVIPDAEYMVETVETPQDTPDDKVEAADTVAAATETLKEDEEPLWIFRPKNECRLTLALPMKSRSENPGRNHIDFYSGVLLATRDLAEEGISTELNVYDITDESDPIDPELLKDSDVIIGPVSSGDLKRMLAECPETVNIVSPLDQRAESLAFSHANFIQAPAPYTAQYNDIANWIVEDTMAGDKVLVISERGTSETEAVKYIKAAIDSTHLEVNNFSYSILEGRDVITPLTELMTAEGTNRVVIASESEAFVNDVVRNLNIMIHQKMNIVLYSGSRIRGYETIEVENLHNTSLHVSLAYYIDYDDKKVRDFLMKYRALFNTEPTQFAFQGYDLASYFIKMAAQNGNRWDKRIASEKKDMLQSTIDFMHAENGGYINNGVRRIVYGKDWSVNRVR